MASPEIRPAHVRIETSAHGAKSIVVEGVDVTESLSSAVLQFQAGQPPILQLQMLSHLDSESLELDGIVVLQASMYESVRGFLDEVDPERLEARVLNETAWDTNPIAAALEVLKEWARTGVPRETDAGGGAEAV